MQLDDISEAVIIEVQKTVTPSLIYTDLDKAKDLIRNAMPEYRSSACIYAQGVYHGIRENQQQQKRYISKEQHHNIVHIISNSILDNDGNCNYHDIVKITDKILGELFIEKGEK